MKLALITTDNRENSRDYGKPEPWFGTAVEALLQGFAALPELEVHVVSCTQRPMQSPARLAPNIYFHSLLVPKLGWMRTFYLGCIRAIRRKLRQLQPGIVHGQGTERECALGAVLSGFPAVITVHGNMRVMAELNAARPFSFSWLAARLEAFTLPRAAGVICITDYTRRLVAPLNSRTWLLPNAVDQSFFDVRPAPSDPPTILCVGAIGPRKNQNDLIRALDPLAPSTAFRLVFLGETSPGDSYGAEFAELVRTRPWCEFDGFVDRAALRSRLANASSLVLPSHEDNCPMVVLEAMAAGISVAASRVGGVPELIRDGETGLLFDPNNARQMREAVARLVNGGGQKENLAARAKEEALRRFLPAVIARRHLEIYHDVLGLNS